MTTYYGKQMDTKILILSKGAGCKYCTQLDMFLNMALAGEFNDKVTKVLQDDDLEYYTDVVEGEGFMQAPIMINVETGESLTGFDASQVMQMLQSA